MVLKENSTSNNKQAVRALQYLLDLEVDGVYGIKTYEAVVSFQESNSIEADGIFGKATATKLVSALPDVKYKDYSASKYVKAVQSLVGATCDGKYGSGTKANVVAFQSSAVLDRSGNVTKNDWLALFDCDYTKTIVTTSGTNKLEPVDYKQYDSRWGKKMYSSHNASSQTIANSGCGPTSMSDIMATWVDVNITPVEMCKYATDHGYRTYSSGTAWEYFKSVFNTYASRGFSQFVQTKSLATLKSALAEGAFAVASMAPGYWTKAGHFICVYEMDDTYVYAKDPASSVRKKQKIAAFENERKQFFIFWKK